MRYNDKWKKIGSGILAVCLILSLLLSNQSFGVFAEEDAVPMVEDTVDMVENQTEEADVQMQENQAEENAAQPQDDNQTEESNEANNSGEENNDVVDMIEFNGADDRNVLDPKEEGTTLDESDGFYADDTESEGNEGFSKAAAEEDEWISGEDATDAVGESDDGIIQNPEWTVENGSVSVSGNGRKPFDSITVSTSKNRSKYTGNKSVIFGYQISAGSAENGDNINDNNDISNNSDTDNINITVTDCGIMSDDNSIEIWKVTDDNWEKITAAVSVSEGKISFVADGLGEYIAVSNVTTVDLTKGAVTVTEDFLKGIQQDGTEIEKNFSELTDGKYRISQSDQDTRCAYKIVFATEKNYIQDRSIILDGINTSGDIEIPAKAYNVMVTLLLRNINQVHRIYYGTANQQLKDANTNSSLKIDDYITSGGSAGELYIPYKMQTQEEKLKYVSTKIDSGIGPNWSQAGIGGGRNGEFQCCTGLTLAGGRICVLVQNQNGATAIGGGGNGDAQISITGGDITAICSSTGSAIGGGIGWINRGGVADISITGGNIYAENIDQYTRDNTSYGGVAIGSGSSMKLYGSEAKINISGNSIVTAYAHYGNGIGSGNSYESTAASASIHISGNANVTTNALGGGTSKETQGGEAEIFVSDSATVNCVKYSDITNKWNFSNENVLGAFGIGGGNSAGDAKGGSAVVNVSGGTLNCNGGNIGGGNATGTGDGGDASISISGGTLDCASIGGGNSVSGTPGAVTGNGQAAGVVVTGGTLRTGTIGGGKNDSGAIGFATADISGGNIQGQFILSNTDTSKKCFFTMTGGTIDNTNLGTGNYLKAQVNGGAVYLSDPSGVVNISGGTIRNTTAELGGAVYMTNGSFTLSGDATFENCKATGNNTTENNNETENSNPIENGNDTESGAIVAQGGAVYLDNGTVTMNGGCILSSSATQGGAIYLKNGTVTLSNGTIGKDGSGNLADLGAGVYVAGGNLIVSGGSIMYNIAKESGAGAYLEKGSMEISSGQIQNNISSQNGAGAYLAGGTLNISGGIITANTATQNGGGVFLNSGNMTLSGGRIYSNTAVNGAGAYLNGGSLVVSGGGDFDLNNASTDGGGAYLAGGALTVESGTFNNNTAANNGGGAYLAGGTLTINGGAFSQNTATNGGGAYASDGAVRMFGGNITNNIAKQDGGGFYVSSVQKAADVVIRSGNITGNTSGKNGAGIAVVGGGDAKADTVILGLLENHTNLNTAADNRSFTSFSYNDSIDNKVHTHASCPVLSKNNATGDGGGIYMQSSDAILNIYCLKEEENRSEKNTNGNGVMMAGGRLIIGDQSHNDKKETWGNTIINSPMLVEGGNVDIWGSMNNPLFEKNILVDIRNGAGKFDDHRTQAGDETRYKVHYFENFTAGGAQEASGIYIANQYNAADDIPALGTIFSHDGWRILGWATAADKANDKITYKIGTDIGNKDDHGAWGDNPTEALVLYAIWARCSYTVAFHPNANTYSGSMADQIFSYAVEQELSPNQYTVTGKRFNGWNTKTDGTGISYAEKYKESRMTLENGVTVDLYAQWVGCTHKDGEHPGILTYTADEDNHSITESCDCGGHTATIRLSAGNAYHDGNAHLANIDLSGTLLADNPKIQYKSCTTADGTYTDLNKDAEPVDVGYYEASITVEGKTVTVRYQIKSAAENVQIDAECIKGQQFGTFTGNPNCNIAKDDAFTVLYTIQKLGSVYSTVPSLVLNQALPTGTTIIMQTEDEYWYNNHPTEKTIGLNTFTKMGGSTPFNYTFSENQEYRFIFDFSKVTGTMLSNSLTVNLEYVHSDAGASDPVNASVTVAMDAEGTFLLSGTSENLLITAPEGNEFSRWNKKNLLLEVTATAGSEFPEDARLVVRDNDKTYTYRKNIRDIFIIPIGWSQNDRISLFLESDLASKKGEMYSADVKLCVGNEIEVLSDQPQAVEYETKADLTSISLEISNTIKPSLRIDGSQKILKKTDKLNLTIKMQEIPSGSNVNATIQQKQVNGYGGNFLDVEVKEEQNEFSLGGIQEAGSYRLLVTVTKDKQEILTVPYYFIVQ